MLVFIVPLRSSKVADSWEYVCKLLERCIKSICSQSSTEFRVIVVCHEQPNISFKHPHIIFSPVDFPVPDSSYASKLIDKKRKVVIGLIKAQELNPSHVMVVDADDCVSKYLAEFIKQNPQTPGWFIDKGYTYLDGSHRIYFKKNNFHRLCGTSNIVRYDLYNKPANIENVSLEKYYMNPTYIKDLLTKKGSPMQALPFIGAVYINTNSKEHISTQKSIYYKLQNNPKSLFRPLTRSLRMLFKSQPLNESIRQEFGIYPLE